MRDSLFLYMYDVRSAFVYHALSCVYCGAESVTHNYRGIRIYFLLSIGI